MQIYIIKKLDAESGAIMEVLPVAFENKMDAWKIVKIRKENDTVSEFEIEELGVWAKKEK